MITIEQFYVVGIAVKTQNAVGKAEVDIPKLWERFMTENILTQIPNKVNNDVYCVYTNYDGDQSAPYTTVLGCKVKSIDDIPNGMTGITIDTNIYEHYVATGKVFESIVINEWVKIWQLGLNRTYFADFEVYAEGVDYNNARIDIFVGVKN